MADMIEGNRMFSVALEPWHKKGVILDAPPTSEEAIVQADMDWHVDKRQLYYAQKLLPGDFASEIIHKEAPNAFGLFRDTDNKMFGVVSSDYEVVQNKDSFAFFDPLVREGIASYETAGVLTDGRVWILAKVAGDMVIGNDEIRKYLLMLNDHSGSGSVILQPTPVRAVCNNTLAQSLTYGMVIKHAHRKGVGERLQVTMNELMSTVQAFDDLQETMQQFTQVQMAEKVLEDYFMQVAEVDLSKTDGDQDEKVDRATKNRLAAVNTMQEIHESGMGMTGGTRGTLWGAYNAAVEFADWRMGSRSKDRARYQLFGAGRELKKRAMDTALELVA